MIHLVDERAVVESRVREERDESRGERQMRLLVAAVVNLVSLLLLLRETAAAQQ